ncbi:hypothetical protein M405DRAFT_820213 [Rhizopogon salebrosus TDB-379]|nr:hypothetical protein M405DRAFT_820213 [Rhizopogon salebrosus TDB-379]
MLSLESKLRSEPGFDNSAFHNPMSLARKWISKQLHYYEFDYKYCHDPEQRPPVKLLYKEWEYPEGASDDEEEEDEEEEEKLFIITVLSVCSDDPASFHARPTQAQMDLLTNFLGSQPQWWAGYRGFC